LTTTDNIAYSTSLTFTIVREIALNSSRITNPTIEVFLNSFAVKRLNEVERTVQVYTYSLNPPPEIGKEYSAIGKMLRSLGMPAAQLGETVISKEAVSPKLWQGESWVLQPQGARELNLIEQCEREALEKLERRCLEQKLRQFSRQLQHENRVERSAEGGFIWWNAEKIVLQQPGWEVHTGVHLDISVHRQGVLFLEIDSHHRFYTPWTLQEWLDNYPGAPIGYVRNTYDENSWKYVRTSTENPETVMIPNLGISLANYHQNHQKYKATEEEIRNSRLVYVRNSKKEEIAHLSTRLRPSVTMEVLSYLTSLGQQEAAQVFKQLRKPVRERFETAKKVAQLLVKRIYQQESTSLKPYKVGGVLLRQKNPILLVRQGKVYRPETSLKRGCLRTGEKQFGCLDLVGTGVWSEGITNPLLNAARNSGVEIFLENPKRRSDLPDGVIARRHFWQQWANQGTQTILVVSNWLGDGEKARLRLEALEANIALQFMLPMPRPESYRAVSIVLGLLLKAKWQPVGLEPLQDSEAAEIAIGFDAGTDRNLFYGTSAFAVLANGQSLGWELPEVQRGERLSGQAVLRAVASIVHRFEQLVGRKPRRILLLRDGFVRRDEFEATIAELQLAGIAVDLLAVRKSGAGRMAIEPQSNFLQDASPGTVVLSSDGKTFLIVTTQAKAGGSARPLQVVRDYGDAPLELLATQFDRLCQLNPASGFFSSRNAWVLHAADKMAKEVQRIGQIGPLHGLDREKIFFV
jgi:hypothetical protein